MRDRKSHGRSRVSNGNSLLGRQVDGRSIWVRRCRDLIAEHIADLGGAGNLRRLLEAVGLKRRPRDVTPPTLDQNLAFREQQGSGNDGD
jgi:hypothetical protein